MCLAATIFRILFCFLGLLSISGTALSSEKQGGLNQEYRKLLKEERKKYNDDRFVAKTASGLAALGIGLFGYYNDDRGMLTKLVYSTTQTAGVLIVSDAIQSAYEPSLLLHMDGYLRENGTLNFREFRHVMVGVESQKKLGQYKQLAYTSGILASLYFYNGYREQRISKPLSNVFFFLGFNFSLVSAANFYKMATHNGYVATPEQAEIDIEFQPWPTLVYRF